MSYPLKKIRTLKNPCAPRLSLGYCMASSFDAVEGAVADPPVNPEDTEELPLTPGVSSESASSSSMSGTPPDNLASDLHPFGSVLYTLESIEQSILQRARLEAEAHSIPLHFEEDDSLRAFFNGSLPFTASPWLCALFDARTRTLQQLGSDTRRRTHHHPYRR
jgi:hypothetical protein